MTNYLITKTIDGMLPSMKNQRRIITNRRTGKPMSIKSQGAMEYEAHFLSKINNKDKIGYKDPVSLKVRVWYPSRRNDLDIEYLKDLIAKAGIIENDRQVYHMEAWKGKDKDHPRVIFTLYAYEDAPQSTQGDKRE